MWTGAVVRVRRPFNSTMRRSNAAADMFVVVISCLIQRQRMRKKQEEAERERE